MARPVQYADVMKTNKLVSEGQAYEALRLAQVHEGKGMSSSAVLCAKDAAACFNAGMWDRAHARACESLRYSVGCFHPAFAKAMVRA